MPNIALVHTGWLPAAAPATRGPSPSLRPQDDALLVAALRARGASVEPHRLDDPTVDWTAVTIAVMRSADLAPADRPEFLSAVQHIAGLTSLWNPVEVLRWNTHSSYLLELEERGAPVVPTAWAAQGDRVDLQRLLAARQWDTVSLLSPLRGGDAAAVRVGRDGVEPAEGQRHLDILLKDGDAMIQRSPPVADHVGSRSVVVIDGEVSHVVRSAPAGRRPDDVGVRIEPADPEIEALTRWIIDAMGVELLYACVHLQDDELGSPQLVEVDATAPELLLAATDPAAAEAFADAILRRGQE